MTTWETIESGMDDLVRRALASIESCDDPVLLGRMIDNARVRGIEIVERAAQRKLYAILPSAEPGTLEHDVWQSIFALEGALKEERKKTVLLSRTRQKIARDGEQTTVSDLVRKAPSEGFRMLIERDMPELTFEAVALRHPDRFTSDVLNAARDRLSASERQG